MRTKFLIVCALLAVACWAPRSLAGPKPYEDGTFALLGGSQKITSHFWPDYTTGTELKIRQFRSDDKTPILKYDIDMQKTMHLVVIRDDFATFDHLHPDFDLQTGTFSAHFRSPDYALYYVFADSEPHGVGQQVFRFKYDTGSSGIAPKISMTASAPNAPAGPYTVSLQTTTVPANKPQLLDLTVSKGDDPAEDLVPYLGAAAHCVLINVKTLSYVHVHPMLKGSKPEDMSHMSNSQMIENADQISKAGPFMQMQLPALPAGSYKTWIQIKGGPSQHTYTAAFTLVAQ